MCNGEDHGLFARRTKPNQAISTKFAFAAASFCGGSGLAFARIGWPRVSIVWRASCFGWSILKLGTATDGNLANNLANGDWFSVASNASPVIRDLRLLCYRGIVSISSGWTSFLFSDLPGANYVWGNRHLLVAFLRPPPKTSTRTSSVRHAVVFSFSVATDFGTICGDEFFLHWRTLPILVRCWHDADLGTGIDKEGFVCFWVV